jgi:hypothetical protein
MGSQGLPEVAGVKGSGGSAALNFSTLHNEIDKAILEGSVPTIMTLEETTSGEVISLNYGTFLLSINLSSTRMLHVTSKSYQRTSNLFVASPSELRRLGQFNN